MSIKKSYIEHLRELPAHKSRRVALTFSLVVTALIIGFWAVTIGGRIDKIYANENGKGDGIFSGVKESFANALTGFENIKSTVTKTIKNEIKVENKAIEIEPINR